MKYGLNRKERAMKRISCQWWFRLPNERLTASEIESLLIQTLSKRAYKVN